MLGWAKSTQYEIILCPIQNIWVGWAGHHFLAIFNTPMQDHGWDWPWVGGDSIYR